MTETKVYLIFGPQGSGKSTQAELLADYLKLPFFDSGKQLRLVVEGNGENAAQIRKIMKTGTLVPNHYLRVIFDNFLRNHDCTKGLVVDGFPRTMKQAELLEELANENHWEIDSFYVEISDKTAKERLSKRHQVVGGKRVVREDDQPAVVEKRLQIFRRETLPVIYWLKSHHRIHVIDGEPSREKVFEQIKLIVDGKK